MKAEMRHTNLSIKERNRLTINGVSNIESFDDGYITLEIDDKRVFVEGAGLKIESLSQEDGEIKITGRIDGVFYGDKKKLSGKLWGLFGWLDLQSGK